MRKISDFKKFEDQIIVVDPDSRGVLITHALRCSPGVKNIGFFLHAGRLQTVGNLNGMRLLEMADNIDAIAPRPLSRKIFDAAVKELTDSGRIKLAALSPK